MFIRRLGDDPLLLGLVVESIFGIANLVFTCLSPVEEDTPGALLQFATSLDRCAKSAS